MEDFWQTILGIAFTLGVIIFLMQFVSGIIKAINPADAAKREAQGQMARRQALQEAFQQSITAPPVRRALIRNAEPPSVEQELTGAEGVLTELENLEKTLGSYEVTPQQYEVQNLTGIPAEEGASLLTPTEDTEAPTTTGRKTAHPLARLFKDKNNLRNAFMLNEVLGRKY
jgi:hypothetical protein